MEDPPGDHPPDDFNDTAARPRPAKRQYSGDEVSRSNVDNFDVNSYKPYLKPGYTRVFPENAAKGEYSVLVESTKDDNRLGNQNPLVLANLFKNEIKGVKNIKRINASKVSVMFEQALYANAFIKNVDFLTNNFLKAYIPARAVETIGVVRFVPTSISNEELFKKLSSAHEIIGVRRFMKKQDGQLNPLGTISITFLTNTLPDYVYLDIYRFRVDEYKAPLLQCYKCFKFNHGAKICKSIQKCSICTMDHHFSQCSDDAVIKCINCGGAHLAVSRDCPFKKQKIAEKDARQSKYSYAQITSTVSKSDFPALPMQKHQKPPVPLSKPLTGQSAFRPTNLKNTSKDLTKKDVLSDKELINQIINNDYIMKGLVGALVSLGSDDRHLTSAIIKEILIEKLKT